MRFAAVSIVALSLGSMAVAYPAENMQVSLLLSLVALWLRGSDAGLRGVLADHLLQTEAALPNFDLLLAGPPADCWDHNTDESACHAWS